MRNGKIAARPSGLWDVLKARMEHRTKLGNIMMSLKGLAGAQAPFGPLGQTQSNLVKASQSENRGLMVKSQGGCEISQLAKKMA
jgi:hypothetical protein